MISGQFHPEPNFFPSVPDGCVTANFTGNTHCVSYSRLVSAGTVKR